jgi:hypothetical protein
MSCVEYDELGNEVVSIDTLMPKLLMRVGAMPFSMGMMMLRDKYIDFARRTGCVRMCLPLDIQADVRRYPIPIPSGHHLYNVRAFTVGEHMRLSLPDYWRGWRGMYGHYGIHIDESNYVVLSCPPRADDSLRMSVHVQLTPRSDVDCIPAMLADNFGDAIAAGAAAEAMNNREKPWYDPGNSVRLAKLFSQAINDARANVERGKTGAAYMRTRRWI